jgi:Fic/DOC family
MAGPRHAAGLRSLLSQDTVLELAGPAAVARGAAYQRDGRVDSDHRLVGGRDPASARRQGLHLACPRVVEARPGAAGPAGSLTRYLALAEYFWLAEQVTGVEAAVLVTASRVELADSALHAPAAGFGDQDFYPDLVDKAAVLTCRLAWNHPLPDGNKRAARWPARSGAWRAARRRARCTTAAVPDVLPGLVARIAVSRDSADC